MMSRTLRFAALAILFAAMPLFPVCGQQRAAAPFHPPDDIAFRQATIVSEGTRMAAEVFSPKTASAPQLPTIVMSHGWGGTASSLRSDAVFFARAGYLVVIFDYRGWGASDSRVILTNPQPPRTRDLPAHAP
jgi:cephalosporin-C deacetylase-like acetyl esterase